MPYGSIPHDKQRKQSGKRHAQVPENGNQHASDDVENMSVEELLWQMEKTENDLLDTIRLLIRQCEQYNRLIPGADRNGQYSAAWIASWAHNPGDVADLNRLCDALNDGDLR